MIKPISAKQFLMLGLCFCAFAVAQGFFVNATFVEPDRNEGQEMQKKYCTQPIPMPGKIGQDVFIGSNSYDPNKCDEAKSLLSSAEAAARVGKICGLGGGLAGLTMFLLAAVTGWRTRKQEAGALA